MSRPFFTALPYFFFMLLTPCNADRKSQPGVPGSDGPYVLYRNGKVIVKYVDENEGTAALRMDSASLENKKSLDLVVRTDEAGKTFTVRLKQKLEEEKTEYDAEKIFIVSDIEGDFRSFRRLLQGSGVIDSSFNWTFGDGHLVLTGDFFDRGMQVTEVLWLIYSLEDKAKAAGGYVHYVLGNHEIMNLNGDIRYVHQKYFANAALMQEDYMTLFGRQSELGRWLRTKNIAEKVGDILFVHGGISGQVNDARVPLRRMSNLARPYYDDSLQNFPNDRVALLYSDLGPFWYRGYYSGTPLATINQLDSSLSFFRAKHIATGHTVISDTIRILHGGKLINTDVHHAKGHSEGLLVEGNRFYRVDAVGQRFLVKE